MQYLVALTVVLFFATLSAAEKGPTLGDVLYVSVSGYVSTYYGFDGKYYFLDSYIGDDEDYAKLLTNTLVKELKQATAECEVNRQVVNYAAGALAPNVKGILDSLKIENKFDEYKIISAILFKYAANNNDTYFHKDFRDDHPEHFGVVEDISWVALKESYYFDEDTPLNGVVLRGINGVAAEIDFKAILKKLLPPAYMPTTRRLYDAYVATVSVELTALKGCLAEVSAIDDKVGAKRRAYNAAVTGENSIFAKFGAQELMER